MGKPKSLRVKVAGGVSPTGHEWSLWWPAWKWQRLSDAERAEVIRRQAALMGQGNVNQTP